MASGWQIAWCQFEAGIFAFAVDAGERFGTIGIVHALEFNFWLAVDVRITNQTDWTFAHGQVILSVTFGAR